MTITNEVKQSTKITNDVTEPTTIMQRNQHRSCVK